MIFSTRLARSALTIGLLWGLAMATPSFAQTPAPPPAHQDTPSIGSPPAADPQASGDASSSVSLTLAPRPALVISSAADWDDGLRAIMETHDRLRAEMGKAGLQAGGRPIAVFTETDDKGFRYEAMIPLAGEPAAGQLKDFTTGVKIGATPAGKAMKFEHRGSYDDIDSTYEAITAYLDEKGLEAQNLFIEEYLSTPKSADDQDMEVDIYVFVK